MHACQTYVIPRFGAVGKHGFIAVTERVILTLKQEWLKRALLIRGIEHLTSLLDDFTEYYNNWRGHTKLEGAVPAMLYLKQHWQKPEKTAKQIRRVRKLICGSRGR